MLSYTEYSLGVLCGFVCVGFKSHADMPGTCELVLERGVGPGDV